MSFVRLPADKHMAGPLENQSSFWLAKAAIAKSFSNRKPPVNLDTRDSLSQIVGNLYLSSCHLEAQKDVLTRKGVTHILQVGKELSPTHPAAFTYKHIPVYDLEEEDLVKYFRECFDFINAGRENGAVLVHCAAGVSRSASVVIGYLMATGGLSLEDARAAVKAARPAINPNQGFLLQLQLFQDAGCSAEGWQQWDLERFLRVRSAAYSRRDTPAALVLDAAKSSGNLMRGACEVSPPTLSREDSISPAGSPTHSPSRTTDGTQGPFFGHANITTAASAAVATTAPADPAAATSTSSAVDHPGGAAALPSAGASRGGGFGRDGLMATGEANPEQEIMGMVADGGGARGSAGAVPCSRGAGGGGGAGRGNRMVGPSYRLPTLPAVGGAAAGVVMAAASATWAAIVGASSGGREAGGFWPPHSGPRPAPPLPAYAPVVGAAAPVLAATPPTPGGPSPVPLPLSRSLQRQRSADDAVAPPITSMRTVATSSPSIGVVTVDATSNAVGIVHGHTSNPSSNNSNISLIPAARHSTAPAAAVSPTSLPSRSCPPADELVTTRARTTSGTADASSLATLAAVQAHEGVQHLSGTPGSLPAWARPEAQPIASHIGQVPVSQGAGVDTGLDVGYRAGSASPMTTWPGVQQAHGDRVTSANSRSAGGGVGPDQGSIEVMPVLGAAVKHASYYNNVAGLYSTGGVPAADGTGTAVEMSDLRSPWLLEVTPSPPVQQPQRLSQRSIDAGGLPALSPIPSDVGSDEAGGSDADEGSGDVSGGIGADGRTGVSERQWRAEDAVNPTPTVPQRGHYLPRRSLSDRLQGMLTRAYRDGIDTADGGRENTPCSVGEVAGHVTMSQPSPFTKTTTAAVATPVTATAAAAAAAGPSKGFGIGDESTGSGKGNGVDDGTLGVGLTDQPQLHQPQPMVAMTRTLFGGGVANLTASAVAAVDPATRRLCADSGVSSGLLAPFWPDVSASDASSSNKNNNRGTAASWMSGGEGGARAGGGSIVEERSDASSSAITVVAGRTENDCRAASQGTPWQDSPGLRTAVSVSPEEAAGGSWAARHQQHWTLLSILAPAGLERTPSKTPQTPVAAAGYDEAGSKAGINAPAPQEGVADWMGIGPTWPEARTITPYDNDLADGSAAPAAAAARSTALKHLVAAQAFSYAGGANAVPAVAATTTLAAAASAVGATPAASNTLHGQPNPDILASRTSGSVGSSTGPPWSPHLGAYGDWYGPGRTPALAGSHCVHADGGQHTPKVPFATAAKAASRLATTTFADSTGGDDGSWDGQPTADQRCERGRSTSNSGVGHGYRGSEAAAIGYNENTASAVTYGGRRGGEGEEDDGTRNADGDNIDSMPSLRRRSAPVRMGLGLQTSSAGIAAAAALPPAEPVSSPTPAPLVGGPVRSLRLSIRNVRGPNGSSGDGAGVLPADLGRGEGGSGTPIHKRVLRSLTFFLGRSSESPTGATDAASAAATGVPSQTEGLASGEEVSGIDNNAQLAAVPVARRRLWSGMRAGEVAAAQPLGGAAGAADSGGGWQTVAEEGIAVNRNVAGLHYLALKDQDAMVTGAYTTSAAQTQLASIRDDFAGTAVRAAVQLPPAASTIISDAVHAPDSSGACAQPRQPSWAGGAALGAMDGNADGGASATMIGSRDEVNSNDDAAQVGVSQLRVLSRSTSCHPTCTTTAGTGDEVPSLVTITSGSEGTAGSRPIQAKMDKVEAAEEAYGEEVVVDLDLLPNGPFRWDPSPSVDEWQPGDVAPLATNIRSEGGWCEVLESTGLAPGVSKCSELNNGDATPLLATATARTKTSAAAPAAAPVGPAGAAFNCNGARRFSLDGCKHEDDSSEADRLGPLWPKATRAVMSVGPGPGSMAAATTAAYFTNLMGVASAALLPVHSSSLQLDMAPPDTTTPALATATAIAVTTTTSSQPAGPASAPVSAAIDAWWCTSDAAGGDVSGMQRSVSLGPQGLALPLPLGPATTWDQPPGRQVMATYGATVAAARGSVFVQQAYDPAANGSASNNSRTGPTPARQPRSSYSGAVSMLPPMSRHELEALLRAGTVDTGAPPQWQPHPTGTDKQQLPSEPYTDTSRRSSQAHSLDRGPVPVPLPGTQPLPSATQQHTQQARGGGVPYISGAAGEGAGAAGRPGLPAWGGSRSSASLMTMPSDPESPVTGLNRPTGRAQQNGSGLELQQPQQQHLSGLGAGTPSVPPGRATVRSSSTGSSAAAHAAAAAAGSPGANSAPAWEHLRAVRQHQQQLMQQQQQPQPLPAQQQSLLRVQQPFHSGGAPVAIGSFLTESFPLPGMSTPETGNTQGTHDTLQCKPFSTSPFLDSSPEVLLVGPVSRTAIGWEAPATSTASAAQPSPPCPATPTGPGGSPTTSPSITVAAAATTAIRLSLSPAVSSGGSSSSVQSPRAPPAMPDILDTNPWDLDAMDGPSQPTAVMATPAPAPVALALGPAWGRLDASLLKPVLGRRLLPMPSPSRIISSAAATPRGSAGGAGASTGWVGAGMMLMRTPAASTAVQLSPERSSPQPGAVDVAMAHVASVSAGPSPPHTAALQVPEPYRTRLTDSHVLPPHELRPPAFNAAAGSPSAIAVTSFAGMQVDSGGQVSPGGVASATSPQSEASSTAGGRVEWPLDFPGTWSSPLVRSPSAMCDSRSNSDGEGPNDEVT